MIGKGKISEAEIKELKAAYPGQGALLKYTFPNGKDDVVFRPISTDSYERLTTWISNSRAERKAVPIKDVHEKIFDDCVLWPRLTIEEKTLLPVGVVPTVVKVIQERSGFLDVDIMERYLGPDVHSTILRPFPFWGDVPEEALKKLKDETPFPLYKTRVESCVFVIRPMTRTDVRVAEQAGDDQLALVKCVTMWPEEVPWDAIPAGWIEALGRAANQISGWEISPDVEEL